MNNVPMKLDYSKTINEQLPTFEYYKNRYASYELQIMKLQEENDKLKLEINMLRTNLFNKVAFTYGIRGTTRSDVDDE